MSVSLRTVGLAWFASPADFAWAKREFIDGHGLPPTYREWLKRAEFGVNRLRTNGHAVERVMIDPATFPAWCRENGFELTSRARQHYAGVMVRHLAVARAHLTSFPRYSR